MQDTKLWGFDSETFLIVNQVVPRDVCWTFSDGHNHYIKDAKEGHAFFLDLLKDKRNTFVAQNACFDLCVASVSCTELFYALNEALHEGRIFCTKLAQIMINSADPAVEGVRTANVFIPRGNKWKSVSSLKMEGLAWKYLRKDLGAVKAGSIRTGYGDLWGTPVEEWTDAEREYALNDAIYVRSIFIKQLKQKDLLRDLPRQTYVEYILGMMSTVFGVGINPNKIEDAIEGCVQEHHDAIKNCLPLFKEAKNDRGYSVNTKKVTELLNIAIEKTGVDHPMTETGKLSTKKQAVDDLIEAIDWVLEKGMRLSTKSKVGQEEKDELREIKSMLRWKSIADSKWKEKRTFLDALKNARLNTDQRLRYRYNGLMETGRTSSSTPNLQNIPRRGKARSCITAREGYIFAQADYSNAELRTLAQAHVNEGRESRLAVEYQKNPLFDPHLFMAVQLSNCSYDEGASILKDKEHPRYKELKEKRQLSKIANFGYAGGLGSEQFIDYAKGYGVSLTLQESTDLREGWLQTWSEMEPYFKKRNEMTEYYFKESERYRYIRKFTIGCNTAFQGIASDGAKESIISVFRECFIVESVLNGCIPILFVHDELVLEVPLRSREYATKCATRLQHLMEVGMNKHTPDIPAIAEPCLTRYWTKDAESSWEEGLLSIYEG